MRCLSSFPRRHDERAKVKLKSMPGMIAPSKLASRNRDLVEGIADLTA